MPHLLYYITGHGYGHARRSGQIIAALQRARLGLQISVRTSAAQWLFDPLIADGLKYTNVAIDSGAIEVDPLRIDGQASLDAALAVLNRRDIIIEGESQFARDQRASLIVADVPYLAGDIA